MGRLQKKLDFTLPERSKPGKGSFDFRTSAVERWVEELPLGNTGETAKRLYEALQEVNQLEISWKDRLALLERFRQPVAYVQDSLWRHYTGMPLPLPPKTQRIANLAQSLYSEMAMGYKIALLDALGGLLSPNQGSLRQLLHRAIRYLSQAMLTCYQTYAPHPKGSWLELHQLYLFALDKDIHQEAVEDPFDTQMPKSSIAKVYKQILLLALASPYRLRQSEAENIYHALVRWTGHVHILPYDHPEASEALFVVHTDSDEAPDYQAFDHRDCDSTHCTLVDTRQLSQVLQEEYRQMGEDKLLGLLSRVQVFRLICAWGNAPKREFERANSDGMVEIVVGTTMLHHALAMELGEEEMIHQRASYQSKAVPNVNASHRDDIWNLFASNKVQREYEQYAKKQLKQRAADEVATKAPPKLQTQHWQLHNQSTGGYRLSIGDAQECKIQVGELIGLRHTSDEPTWQVGVARWLRQSEERGLEIGVQILAPEARPAMVKNEKSRGRAGELQYALLLPETTEPKQPPTIITPTLLFQPGNELQLHLPGEQASLRLEESIQDSTTFIQFRYSIEDGQHATPRAHELGDLWDQL